MKARKFILILVLLKKAGFIYLFLCICAIANAQTPSAYTVATIEYTKKFICDSLQLNIGENFYPLTDTAGKPFDFTNTGTYVYVYASYANERKSVFGTHHFRFFGQTDSIANRFADSLKKKGHHVLIYKTAGNSAAQFNKRILNYAPGTIAFIMLHEAVHRHRQQTKAPLPYVFEEALCDVIANRFAPHCVTADSSKKNIVRYISINEKIYAIINRGIQKKQNDVVSTRKLNEALQTADAFQRDRFGYEVNNAYYLRYTAYCKYYFVLKKVMMRYKSPVDFYHAVMKLSGSEKEVYRKLKKLGK